jgi:hypothetical protein
MRLAVPVLSAALLLAACGGAERPENPQTLAGLDKALAGRVAGQAMSCVPVGPSSLHTSTYGRTILYRDATSGAPIYRNDTAGGCEGAARGDILVSVEHEGRPCAGDIIHTVDPTSRFMTGSCALGQFVPYTKPRR